MSKSNSPKTQQSNVLVYGLLAVIVLLVAIFIGRSFLPSKTDSNDLKKLTFVLDWTPNTNHSGLYVAQEKGFFQDEGLAMEIVQPADESSATLVAHGRGQLGISFQPNLVKRLVKGLPVRAVAAICQHNTGALMSLKSKGINSPKDLAGKRYSTWEDPIDDASIRSLVESDGSKWSDVALIPGTSTDATAALRLDQFDAIFAYYGWDGIHAAQEKVDCNFLYLKELNPVFDYYSPVIIANQDFLDKEPDTAKAALRAITRGYLYAANNPNEAAELLIKNAPETDPDFIHASQAYLSKQYLDDEGNFGSIDPERWDRFYDWVNNYEDENGKLVEKPLEKAAGMSTDFLPKSSDLK